jgi:DNA-directed RNA polymerase specialized sigma24 family protein
MFIHNQIIDAVQGAKKQFVNTMVTDAKFKEELVKLIDAQAAATKTSVEASLAIAQAFVKNSQDAFKAFVPAKSK